MRAWRVQRQELAPGRQMAQKLVQVRAQRLAPEPVREPGPEPVRVLELDSAQGRAQGVLSAWRAGVQIEVRSE